MEFIIYFVFAFALFYTMAWLNHAICVIGNSILGTSSGLSANQILWPTLGWTLFFYFQNR